MAGLLALAFTCCLGLLLDYVKAAISQEPQAVSERGSCALGKIPCRERPNSSELEVQ